MNLTLDIKNLTDRQTLEDMIATLGGEALDQHARARKDARIQLERALSDGQRAAWITYSDAVNDGAGVREDAAIRAGLLLGVGVGVAINAYPDHDVLPVATFAADIVSGVVGAGVGSVVAQDIARQVLRALGRLTGEPAAL